MRVKASDGVLVMMISLELCTSQSSGCHDCGLLRLLLLQNPGQFDTVVHGSLPRLSWKLAVKTSVVVNVTSAHTTFKYHFLSIMNIAVNASVFMYVYYLHICHCDGGHHQPHIDTSCSVQMFIDQKTSCCLSMLELAVVQR